MLRVTGDRSWSLGGYFASSCTFVSLVSCALKEKVLEGGSGRVEMSSCYQYVCLES